MHASNLLHNLKTRVAELADDLGTLEALIEVDIPSSLNKIRFITEKALQNLCKKNNVSWGEAEPTLERMIGPLVSHGCIPKSVAVHVRTIQGNTSPGSHFQESALTPAHVSIAQNALVEFLNWCYRDPTPAVSAHPAVAAQFASVSPPRSRLPGRAVLLAMAALVLIGAGAWLVDMLWPRPPAPVPVPPDPIPSPEPKPAPKNDEPGPSPKAIEKTKPSQPVGGRNAAIAAYLEEAMTHLGHRFAKADKDGFVMESGVTRLFGCFLPKGNKTGNEPWQSVCILNRASPDRSYRIVAAGDNDSLDLDLRVLDPSGSVVVEDNLIARATEVTFRPIREQSYTVQLRLYDSRNNCVCIGGILTK
jgi:hypothetical protein